MTQYEEEILKQIGERIRKYRIEKRISQQDLAELSKLSPPHISNIEQGKVNCSITSFVKILSALDISADAILRPDTAVGNQIFQREFSDLLSDCSALELEAILKIVGQLKSTMRTNDNSI